MRETINGADLRRMIISAAAAIEINKQALNELNVFPVPDGDTGTNMSMTINSAASDLRKTEDPDLEKASKVAASAMLRGARGNSGVILSLLFRGISKRLKGSEECDGVLWAQALQEGVDAAYKAVMKPAEGTILTVARLSAAKAADAARENNFIEFVHEAAIEEAVKALADTVNQNPVLKKAGVVDAGGKGWVVALEAMLSALQGEDVVLPENGAVTQTSRARTSPTSIPRTSPSPTAPSSLFPGKMTVTPRISGRSCPSWATALYWWTTTRSSRCMSIPTIPARR